MRPAQLENGVLHSDRRDTGDISPVYRGICLPEDSRWQETNHDDRFTLAPAPCREFNACWPVGHRFFLPGDIYMSRGGSLVTAKSGPLSAVVCLLCSAAMRPLQSLSVGPSYLPVRLDLRKSFHILSFPGLLSDLTPNPYCGVGPSYKP